MSKTSRRDILHAGATFVAGMAGQSVLGPTTAVATPSRQQASKWEHEYTFGHTILFMEEYHQGTMEILGRQSGELDQIGELTSRALERRFELAVAVIPNFAVRADRRRRGLGFVQPSRGQLQAPLAVMPSIAIGE